MGYTKYIELVKRHKKNPYYEVVRSKDCIDFDDKFYMEVLANPQIDELLPWNIEAPVFKGNTSKGRSKTIKITEVDVDNPSEIIEG